MFPLYPTQMSAEQKGLGDRAMGDGVQATVSVKAADDDTRSVFANNIPPEEW